MNYSSISPIQRLEIVSSILLFLVLFGFVRTILLYPSLNTQNVIFITLFFAIWLILVRIFTNLTIFPYIESKLNPYPASTTTNTDPE